MKKLNENEPIIITREYTIDMLEDGTYIRINNDREMKNTTYNTFAEVLGIYSLYGINRDYQTSIEAILNTLEKNNIPFQYDSRRRMLTLIDRVYCVDDIFKNIVAFYDSILK